MTLKMKNLVRADFFNPRRYYYEGFEELNNLRVGKDIILGYRGNIYKVILYHVQSIPLEEKIPDRYFVTSIMRIIGKYRGQSPETIGISGRESFYLSDNPIEKFKDYVINCVIQDTIESIDFYE